VRGWGSRPSGHVSAHSPFGVGGRQFRTGLRASPALGGGTVKALGLHCSDTAHPHSAPGHVSTPMSGSLQVHVRRDGDPGDSHGVRSLPNPRGDHETAPLQELSRLRVDSHADSQQGCCWFPRVFIVDDVPSDVAGKSRCGTPWTSFLRIRKQRPAGWRSIRGLEESLTSPDQDDSGHELGVAQAPQQQACPDCPESSRVLQSGGTRTDAIRDLRRELTDHRPRFMIHVATRINDITCRLSSFVSCDRSFGTRKPDKQNAPRYGGISLHGAVT
jgi:hypothetical protein